METFILLLKETIKLYHCFFPKSWFGINATAISIPERLFYSVSEDSLKRTELSANKFN